MKVIAIVDCGNWYGLVVDEKPEEVSTMYGNDTIISVTGNMFYDFLYYERPHPKYKAFAGRKFEIKLDDGRIIKCDGQWWDGISKRAEQVMIEKGISVFEDFTLVGMATIKELVNCYVFSGFKMLDRDLKEILRSDIPVYNNKEYREIIYKLKEEEEEEYKRNLIAKIIKGGTRECGRHTYETVSGLRLKIEETNYWCRGMEWRGLDKTPMPLKDKKELKKIFGDIYEIGYHRGMRRFFLKPDENRVVNFWCWRPSKNKKQDNKRKKVSPVYKYGVSIPLCRCNNCMSILYDESPDLDDCPETKVDDIPDKVKIKKMIRIEENEESYWACPECMTDAYLISIHF